MPETIHRHDITDKHWALLDRIYLGGQVFGAEWHKITVDLSMRCFGFFARVRRGETRPPRMADGKTPIDAFAVGDQGIWESLLEKLIVEPDYEWLMIDASHCKVPPMPLGHAEAIKA